jgi:hypothetical protein
MKNRKGFLLGEETLKIVIAVICIVFLVYFLMSLYLSNKTGKNLELAKASLQSLLNGITEKTEAEIYNPSGWYISSFPQTIKPKLMASPEKVIPKQCSNLDWNNCICICKTVLYARKNIGELCDKNGFCLESDFITEGKSDNIIRITTKTPLILTINQENKKISEK